MATRPKLLVVYGPTACGKTQRTIDLAKKHNGEVVIADSRQIYRGMNIGTGKITTEEMQGIPHHMLDIRDIDELYGVGEYAPEARRIIGEIIERGKQPILSGGTGLFIDAVIGGFTIPDVTADWELRNELEEYRKKEGNDALWQKLYEIDPTYAAQLDPRNYRYVIRGIEIFRATGRSKLELGQKTESPYAVELITPYNGNRAYLYERINKRVQDMFDNGLVEELKGLIKNYELRITNKNTYEVLKSLPGLNAIGYREILPYLSGVQSLERTIELVQQNSRHYAKRQLTWFRRYTQDKPDRLDRQDNQID